MKILEYLGKDPYRLIGVAAIKIYKKGDKVEFSDGQAVGFLRSQPKLWKEIKPKKKEAK